MVLVALGSEFGRTITVLGAAKIRIGGKMRSGKTPVTTLPGQSAVRAHRKTGSRLAGF
jgi:hypothetical protein